MKAILFAAALLMSTSAMAGSEIAITVDDLPSHGVLPAGTTRMEIADQVIAAFKAGGIPPTVGFVNASLINAEPDAAPVLKRWHDAGNLLGNHTYSHPGLSKTALADYVADLVKNEPTIAAAAGATDWHWFRYPFIDEGKDEAQRADFRAVLAQRGYKVATVTTGLNDWDYPAPYARCLAKNDTASIAKLEAMYLKRAEDGLTYSRALSEKLYGREVPYILLLHIGSFQAHMMPKLIAMYKEKGVRFVSIEQAMKDPHYAAYTDPSLPSPPRDMEHALAAKNLPTPAFPDWRSAELDKVCR